MRRATPRPAAAALAVLLLASIPGLACRPRIEERLQEEGRLGTVRVVATAMPQAGLVYLFSGVGGWSPDVAEAAERIARTGALVVGVDLDAYLRGLRKSDDGCHYVVAELEDLSHRLQREHGFVRYRSPIVTGVGAGGTLAYAALAQSPAATLGGAISVDPAPALATRVPLCAGAPATAEPAGGYRYDAASELPGFWWVSPSAAVAPALRALAQDAPPTVGGSGTPGNRLAALAVASVTREAPAATALADLPLVELATPGAATQMAVVYSGDGGWRDLDKEIAEVFAREGTPVVGVDSLRYFWSEKTPETVAADLARILRHYRARWGVHRLLLVGYSFGAQILPFALDRLPRDLRDEVVQVSLLGIAARAPFQISVTGWLGEHGEGLPVLPELRALDLARVQCVYGEEEDDTLCTAPELAEAERIRIPGGHHFDGDYEALAHVILQGAARRSLSPRPAPG